VFLHSTQTPQPPHGLALPADFTRAMSRLASGVVMVTCRLDGRPWGLTVSAVASVSAEPPTILVSLGSETASARTIAASKSFGVSILGRHHRAVARRGSTPGASKFVEHFVDEQAASASPAIAGALAHLDCVATEQVLVADHTIFVGLVKDARIATGGEPLVYFRRAYRTLAASTEISASGRVPCPSS
jgi:flavin reductase (DIM6/NTAB) family NADH-FMN oxidoreductase RutF